MIWLEVYLANSITVMLLNFLHFFFVDLKLELSTQFPASNAKKNNEKLFLQYWFISPSIDKEGVYAK